MEEKRVVIFGTFDGLHPGHKFFITEAAEKGSRLIVVLSSDQYIRSVKKSEPIYTYKQRKELLEECEEVDKVIPADTELGSFHVLEHEKPTVVCLGHDQTALKKSLFEWIEKNPDHFRPEVIVIKPYRRDLYSSSRLKNSQ